MPAVSEPPPLPRTWRPLGVRVAGIAAGVLLLSVMLAAWFLWDPETRAKFSSLQRVTMVGLLAMFYTAGWALVRSRVVATGDHLLVVNGFRRRELEWAELIAVHLPPGAPWAVLDLADGTSASAMGIQGSDGARARTAVRELRALVAAHTPGD